MIERSIDWGELRRLTKADRAEPWLLTIPVPPKREWCGCIGEQQRIWIIGMGPREAFDMGQTVYECLKCGSTMDIWDYHGCRPEFTAIGVDAL